MFNIYKNIFDEKSKYNKSSCFYYFTNKFTNNNDNKINCVATIYNTSTSTQPGQHWIATFIKKMDDGSIKMYFFDSVGKGPPLQIKDFLKCLEKKLFFNSKIEKKYNNIQHQYGNSECGVYCIHFIDYMTSNQFISKIYRTTDIE